MGISFSLFYKYYVMISKKSIDMIINHEIGGKAYYEKVLQKPTFPGGQSGVTIGLGYDLGYNTEKQFLEDWSDKLNLNFLTPLRKVIGLKGETAKQMLRGEILQVRVPYNAAYEVFIKKSLPRYYAMTKAIYPELDTLNEDTRGALVSMIYNRGNKIEGDSRKEMKAIVDLVAKADYEGIADQIERSKRLWENKGLDGLVKRREEEADLILNSIA
jgi:GH24 family phage-related lysozyme (muramidase)